MQPRGSCDGSRRSLRESNPLVSWSPPTLWSSRPTTSAPAAPAAPAAQPSGYPEPQIDFVVMAFDPTSGRLLWQSASSGGVVAAGDDAILLVGWAHGGLTVDKRDATSGRSLGTPKVIPNVFSEGGPGAVVGGGGSLAVVLAEKEVLAISTDTGAAALAAARELPGRGRDLRRRLPHEGHDASPPAARRLDLTEATRGYARHCRRTG